MSQKVRTYQDLDGAEMLAFSREIHQADAKGDMELAKKIMQSLPLSRETSARYKRNNSEESLQSLRESGFVFYGESNYEEQERWVMKK